jgi:hypothetical protein
MKGFFVVGLLAVLFFSSFANADTLFYGGDFDPNNPNANGLANENDAIVGGNPYGAATYQNFVVPNGQTWDVTGIFTNNLSQLSPTAGYWELRSGISEGNGGVLVASGTGVITHTSTGRSGFGYTEFNDVIAVPILKVSQGLWWIGGVPVCIACAGRSFNTNTFGLNSIGTQVSNQQFFNSSFFGANFTNANNQGVFPTFSSGVIGTTEVPEPSSLTMLGSGLAAAAGVVRRRLSQLR